MRRLLSTVLALSFPLAALMPFGAAADAAANAQGKSQSSNATTLKATAAAPTLLKGEVVETQTVSPFAADNSQQEVPKDTPIELTFLGGFNSELTNVGDQVCAMVSVDVKNKDHVILPGQWFVHGQVVQATGRKRLGRDGYVTVKFDKLISPDGKHQVPFEATATTKQSTAMAVTKTVATDSVYVSKGAIAGAWLSLKLTGIPVAISTHGYSVAAGAAVGASIGLFGALKRLGKVACVLPGEEVKLTIEKPVVLPNFNPQALPSAAPPAKLDNFDIVVNKMRFMPDPYGDKRSRLLRVDFKMNNQTDDEYSLGNVVVVSDHNRMYYPYALASDTRVRTKRIAPKSQEQATITFGVDSPRRRYWLVLLDRGNREELTRTPIN